MTENRELIYKLEALDVSYRGYHDGGYALVDAICSWAATLVSADKQQLLSYLLTAVEEQNATLWGVALEVLVRTKEPWIYARLCELLHPGRQSEWKDEVARAILRMWEVRRVEDCSVCLAKCVAHIREGIKMKRTQILPVLAALCKVDAETFLELSVSIFSTVSHDGGNGERLTAYLPTFVRNILEADDSLLVRLVSNTNKVSHCAGLVLGAEISDYLTKPWIIKEYGAAQSETLRQKIAVII